MPWLPGGVRRCRTQERRSIATRIYGAVPADSVEAKRRESPAAGCVGLLAPAGTVLGPSVAIHAAEVAPHSWRRADESGRFLCPGQKGRPMNLPKAGLVMPYPGL